MAISHVNTTTTGVNGTALTSVTNNVPTGVADGDLLLWSLSVSGTTPANPSPPAGWSTWQATFGNGSNIEVTIFYRIASSEPASYTISGLTAARWTGIMSAYRGVDTTTPQDATPVTATGTSAPSITTVTDNAWVVTHGKGLTASGAIGAVWATSTGTIAGTVTQTQAAATNDTQGTGYQTKTPAGAVTPTLTVSGGGAMSGQIRITSALRPSTAIPATVNAVTATATATAPAPTVTAAATVAGTAATATAQAHAPTVGVAATAAAVTATATAQAHAPTVTAAATVAAVTATATATAHAPSVSGGAVVTIDPNRVRIIAAESRVFTVPEETRVRDIAAESRVFRAPEESRVRDVDPDTRVLTAVS